MTLERPSLRALAATAAALTLALGVSTVVVWVVLGGLTVFQGPGRTWAAAWPLIAALQVLAAAGIGGMAAQRSRLPDGWLAIAIAVAWVGEGLVLAIGGQLIANELTPVVAVSIWWMATVGPLQPAAAMVGGWLVRRRGQALSASARDSRPS